MFQSLAFSTFALPGRHEGSLLVAQGVQDVGGHQAQLQKRGEGGAGTALLVAG